MPSVLSLPGSAQVWGLSTAGALNALKAPKGSPKQALVFLMGFLDDSFSPEQHAS